MVKMDYFRAGHLPLEGNRVFSDYLTSVDQEIIDQFKIPLLGENETAIRY